MGEQEEQEEGEKAVVVVVVVHWRDRQLSGGYLGHVFWSGSKNQIMSRCPLLIAKRDPHPTQPDTLKATCPIIKPFRASCAC
jgi:hypothetical protein